MQVRAVLRANYPLSLAYHIATEAANCLYLASGNTVTHSGSTHTRRYPDSSVKYIEDVFADYKRYGGVRRFHGRIAEVGPGDNAGVALLLLEDGADSVDLVDRFYSSRVHENQARIYRRLITRHPALVGRIRDHNFGTEDFAEGMRRHYGNHAAAETFFERNRGYDFIVSRAVLEHVRDPIRALRRMAAALKPGGLLLHKVDLRDHGMFTPEFEELKWFEVPDRVYAYMTGSGRPNRVTLGPYRRALAESGLQCRFLVTHLAGEAEEIEPHLPWEDLPCGKRSDALDRVRKRKERFALSLMNEADHDLAVSGFFLIGKRVAA